MIVKKLAIFKMKSDECKLTLDHAQNVLVAPLLKIKYPVHIHIVNIVFARKAIKTTCIKFHGFFKKVCINEIHVFGEKR